MRIGGILVDALLDLLTEMPDKTLHWPSRRIAKRADRVALDLRSDFEQHVDLAPLRAAFRHAGHDTPEPARAFPARRALAAALVLIEIANPGDRPHDVGRLVHHDDGGRAEPGFQLLQGIEIHRRVDDFVRWNAR